MAYSRWISMKEGYWVYIMMNKNNTVNYTGVTNDLIGRVWEHKNKIIKGFTKRYNINKLVYFEEFHDIYEAIRREKQIKGWTNKKKIDLIKTLNPEFKDLYEEILK
jgi:putative endonuclease